MENTATRHDQDSNQFGRNEKQPLNIGSRKNYVLTLVTLILLFCTFFCSPQNKTLAQTEQPILFDNVHVITLIFSKDIYGNEQQSIIDAATYWLDVIKPTVNQSTTQPAIFYVMKDATLEGNAAAMSIVDRYDGNTVVNGVQSILADGIYVTPATDEDLNISAHAEIIISPGWATSNEKSQSGSVNNNLLPVLIHELGHALGMDTRLKYDEPKERWSFDEITRWTELLRDNNGNEPKIGETIGHSTNGRSSTVFELGDPTATKNPSRPTFVGENAMKVFYDGNQALIDAVNSGIPVTGYVDAIPVVNDEGEVVSNTEVNWELDGGGSLSHVDTWYTLLSWQNFRNYQGLIEVEMAVYKDLGYKNIETRDFFGQSFYVSGEGTHGTQSTQQTAGRGFGQWNATTQTYDTTTANTGTFGVGVHLFGNYLNILQKGTINAAGAGSAGIRVDGINNYLTIDPSSEINMSASNGIGLLVAFGKEHIVVHRGTIRAYAEDYSVEPYAPLKNGIAASFDFGLQLFVSEEDIDNGGISSYLRSYYVDPDTGEKLAATNAPLVRRFDVTGKLFGSRASIYIGKTAHVEQINLMRGTEIAGNIISEYSSGGRGTSLTFGLLPDATGQAQSIADDNFKLVLSNNINYDTSVVVPTSGYFDIGLYGGVTNFNSILVHARKLDIAKDATLLLGKSSTPELSSTFYTRISSTNAIANEGTIAGMGDIRIGKWNFDNYKEDGAVTDATANWSETKKEFWQYSIAGGMSGGTGLISNVENYFTPSDRLINNGTISPGKIGSSADGNDFGEYTVGQIDIHGGLVFTEGSTYNLTLDGVPKDQPLARWAIDNDAIWVDGTTTMRGKLKVFFTDNFQKELQELRETDNDDPITYQIFKSKSFSDTKSQNFTELEIGGGSADVKIGGVYVNPYDSTVAQITLFPNPHYFEEKGNTYNTRSVGRAIDNTTWDVPALAYSLLGAKDDPATMNDILHQIANDVRANSIMVGALNPSRFLFPRIGWGNGQMESGERGRIDWQINRERSVMNQFTQSRGQAPQQTPQQLRNGSVWFDYIGQSIGSPSDGNSSSYRTHLNGGLLGGEWNLTQHSALGLTVGYGNGATNSGRDKVRTNDYFAGMYFVATPFNQYEVKAYVGLGRQEYTMYHTIYNSTLKDSNTGQVVGIFDKYYGRTDGTTISMSYEVTRPIMITERFIVRPTLGVDTQHAWQAAFTEEVLSSTSGGLYALSFDSLHLNHNMVRLGFNTESIGPRGSLWLRGFYNFNFGGTSYPTSRVRFTQGGGKFDIRGADIGWDAVNLGAGFHLWLNADHSASFITDFNTDLFIGNSGASAYGLRVGVMHNF
jgi:hypothetical protein